MPPPTHLRMSARASRKALSSNSRTGSAHADPLPRSTENMQNMPTRKLVLHGDRPMKGFLRLLAAALAVLAVPLAAQQEVPMNGNTPRAPQGLASTIPPLPAAPVRYETAEGQPIRVSVYARGFQNPWSMAFVSDDTILVAERGGAIKAVRKGVVDPTPVPGAPRAIGAGLSGTDLALHPDFERNRLVYISYTKPLDETSGAAVPAPVPAAA